MCDYLGLKFLPPNLLIVRSKNLTYIDICTNGFSLRGEDSFTYITSIFKPTKLNKSLQDCFYDVLLF